MTRKRDAIRYVPDEFEEDEEPQTKGMTEGAAIIVRTVYEVDESWLCYQPSSSNQGE